MKNVAIIGAGLVGSLLSVYLSRRGYTVDVYERRSDMRKQGFIGGRSINLALSDRGWRALKGVGLDDHIRKLALPMEGRMIHDVKGNTNLQPYGKEGQAIYSVSRGQLNLELINDTEPDPKVTYHFNRQCIDVDEEKTEATFLNKETGEKETIQPNIILGTDGAFSSVRLSLQKSGMFNFSQEYLEHGYKELTIPANEDGSHKLDSHALHIWPRGSFMLIALPNLDGTFTCTLFLAYKGEVSFENINSDAEIQLFFETYFADTIPLIPNFIDEFNSNPTSSLITIKCKPWHKNKTVILGDASHAIVPFYGQGMNSGFEDCTVLNEIIEECNDDWSIIPEKFSQSRKANADAISDLAMRNFIEMRDLVADDNFLLRKKIEKQFVENYPQRYMPLYSMVTFSQKPYAEALSTGLKHDKLFKETIFKTPDLATKIDQGIAPLQLDKWLDALEKL